MSFKTLNFWTNQVFVCWLNMWNSHFLWYLNLVNVTYLLIGFCKKIFSPNPLILRNPKGRQTQGDPLSPYVLVLCLKRLSQMINIEVVRNNWAPITIGKKGIQVSHLLFVDNMILFTEASLKQIEVVTKCLDLFCKQFG